MARPVLRRGPASVRADGKASGRILRHEPEVRGNGLLGSVAKGDAGQVKTNAHLAVEGLQNEEYLSVWAARDEALCFAPDLVRLDEANETLRCVSERWGTSVDEGP